MNLFVRNEARRLARSASACALALLLAACSTVRPWINEPIAPDASVQPMVADDAQVTGHPVFRGMSFGDLRERRPWPRLLVTATDLTTGVPFEFTPEQFALICSDLESVPLSFAVAASSAVPILLSPVTVRNYAGTCAQSQGLETGKLLERNLSARVLHRIVQSYRNAKERPYIRMDRSGKG